MIVKRIQSVIKEKNVCNNVIIMTDTDSIMTGNGCLACPYALCPDDADCLRHRQHKIRRGSVMLSYILGLLVLCNNYNMKSITIKYVLEILVLDEVLYIILITIYVEMQHNMNGVHCCRQPTECL